MKKMILKLKQNPDKKSQIIVWIQDTKEFEEDVKDIITFFKDQITVKTRTRIRKGYKITSTNPAIMFSLHSAIQDIISETLADLEGL